MVDYDYAPVALQKVWQDIHKWMPSAVLSGILGDAAHYAGGGYHVPRRALPSGDYSNQQPFDRDGPWRAASALDVTLPPKDMKLVTARLLRAAKAGDRRLNGWREFCGTLNGAVTFPWQIAPTSMQRDGVGSWDDSHLWHVHGSAKRDCCETYDKLKGYAEVFCGKGQPLTGKIRDTTIKAATRAWPLKGGLSFGAPKVGHVSSGPSVRWIQARLVALGYVDGIESWTQDARDWCDGQWGHQTTQSVLHFKRVNGLGTDPWIGKKAFKLLGSSKARRAQ